MVVVRQSAISVAEKDVDATAPGAGRIEVPIAVEIPHDYRAARTPTGRESPRGLECAVAFPQQDRERHRRVAGDNKIFNSILVKVSCNDGIGAVSSWPSRI